MKAMLAKLLTGAAGIVVTPLLAKGIAAAVVWLAQFAPDAAATIDQPALLEWLNGLIVALITYLVIRPERQATLEIQATYNETLEPHEEPLKEDGVSLSSTKKAVKDALVRKATLVRRGAFSKA